MTQPPVAVIMGSDSDLPVMQKALDTLADFGVEYSVDVMSAHRTPAVVSAFADGARGNGRKVVIAGAGGAAHLAGVVAANTTLPVIGVPVDSSPLGGVDALYATVQMPPGVPVATVGVNAAQNAALLAVQILAVGDEQLAAKLAQFKQKQAIKVQKKNEALHEKLEGKAR